MPKACTQDKGPIVIGNFAPFVVTESKINNCCPPLPLSSPFILFLLAVGPYCSFTV